MKGGLKLRKHGEVIGVIEAKEQKMRVLFSPLGLSKGSLFTAIVQTRPDHVVVVTSKEGAKQQHINSVLSK